MLVELIQNSAVRFIFNLKKRTHIKPYLKKLHFLPVKERIAFKLALLTFKGLHHIAPSYISELLHLKDPNINYTLRRNAEPYKLRTDCKPNFKRTCGVFSVKAPLIWNSLPARIRTEKDMYRFKILLKTHFYDLAFFDTMDID